MATEQNCHQQRTSVAKIKVMEMFDSPKHFLLQNELYSDSDELYLDSDDDEADDIRFYVRSQDSFTERPESVFMGTPDPDFMMPSQVREILRSEGVSSHVIDRTIRTGERKHRMAQHLTFQQEKKCQRSNETRKNGNKSVILPKLTPPDACARLTTSAHELCDGCKDCRDFQTRQKRRHTRTKPWVSPSSSMESPENGSAQTKSSGPKREEVKFCLTEEEQKQWLAEQGMEKSLVGSTFEPPRLVVVSSKIPKCYLIPKVLLDDENVVYIVYDFDTWSFCDILDAIEKKLTSIKVGCKAKSIMLLCQGGPGYLYVLRKYVLTPQKLRKDSYKNAREFWKTLSYYVSKINQKESKIHIAGCNLSESPQGYEGLTSTQQLRSYGDGVCRMLLFENLVVMKMLQRLIHPNMVYIENVNENKEQGEHVITLYFNTRRYLLWRAKQDDSDDEIDFNVVDDKDDDNQSVVRTWSSIAAEFGEEESDVG